MRILIASHTYAPHLNGQAVFTTNLAEGLVKRGHQVYVLLPGIDRPDEEVHNNVHILGTSAVDLRFIHKDLSIALCESKQMRDIFERIHPDLVHVQDPAPVSQMLVREARKRGIPVVATHHPGPAIWAPYLPGENFVVQKGLVPLVWKGFLDYLNQADMVTAPSRAAARMLLQHGLSVPVRPVSCGVELQQFNMSLNKDRQALRDHFGLPQEKKVFVYVGRLDEEKRVDVLIHAMSFVQNQDVLLALAGGGAREEEMFQLVKELGLGERIQFLGRVQRYEIPDLFVAADVFIMPGDVESLSIATLEAMACGKPVIAANAMALPELVIAGKNGFLFTPGDSEDLGNKIDWMAASEGQWAMMSANSLEAVRKHDLVNTIDTYEQMYRRLLTSTPKAHQKSNGLQLPRTFSNPYFWVVVAQWAAALLFLVLSLLTNNRPVVAAPLQNVDTLGPRMVESLQHWITILRQIDLPSNQASGVLLITQNIKMLFAGGGVQAH
jgi:glycosyltransferase involved in cell wall biosynthesis